jgi:hypothetical protein
MTADRETPAEKAARIPRKYAEMLSAEIMLADDIADFKREEAARAAKAAEEAAKTPTDERQRQS